MGFFVYYSFLVDRFDTFDMIGNGKDIELVIHNDAIFIFAQRKDEPFVEPRLYLFKSVSSIPFVDIHGQSVELFETVHGSHQEDDHTSSLNSLDCPTE